MADVFTILGVVGSAFIVAGVLSLFFGLLVNKNDWEFPAWISCVIVSTAAVSYCIIAHVLKLGQ